MLRRRAAIKNYAGYVSRGKVRTYKRYGVTLVPGEREGVYLYDLNGKSYMNFHCNGGVFNNGHKPVEMRQALHEALERWDVGSAVLHGRSREALALELAERMPGAIARTLLCTSASEAVDAAIKIAMRHTKRTGVVSAEGAYHGGSAFAVAAGDSAFKQPFGPQIPGFTQVPFGDAQGLSKAVDENTAAVILETIPATLGMRIAPEDYFRCVREICDSAGAVMIIDEVQTGLGRTGKLWGIEHWDVTPDIIVIGKGLSGGIYPIAATCLIPELEHAFSAGPFLHFTEYGGSDLGCHVALTVLQRAAAPEYLAHVDRMSEFFSDTLNQLQSRFPEVIEEIRQKGLFMGIAFANETLCALTVKALFDNGLYTVYAGNDKRVMQFLPALTITEQEAAEAMAILEKSLDALSGLRYTLVKKILELRKPKTI